MRFGQLLAPFVLAIPLAGTAASARADDQQASDEAQALFEAGRVLMDNGHPVEACEKFEASNKVEPSAGTLLNMGRCLEAQGKTASALAMYKDTIALGKTQNKPRHVEAAEQFIKDLEPRLARLKISAPDAVPGLTVVRTDAHGASTTLDDAQQGVGVPVDPSTYTVEATAPGYTSWTKTVDVTKAGEVSVVVPSLGESKSGDTPAPKAGWKPDALFIAGTATAGVGLVGLAVGTAFGVITLNDVNDATSNSRLCPNYKCTPKGMALIDSASDESTASTVGLTIGAAAAIAGGVMLTWSLLHRDKTATAKVVIVPVASFQRESGGFVGVAVWGAM